MLRRRVLILMLLCLASTPSAFGQGNPALPQPTVTMLGAGASPCAKYLADLQSGPAYQAVYDNWAMGYLTALNVIQSSRPGGRVLTDASGIGFQLKNYCSANMARSYADAVANLANQFFK